MKLRLPQFTIRDLLWLMVVVGLLSWSGRRERDRTRRVYELLHREDALTQMLMKQGWIVRWRGTTGVFENGKEKWFCPMPEPGTNYAWQRQDASTDNAP